MSLPFRSKEQSSSRRKNRPVHLEATQLEERKLPAPVVDITTPVPTITSTSTGTNTVTITGNISLSTTPSAESAAGYTSVAELTSVAAFGGDMVQISAGPGGDFGKGVYAISRGGGDNNNASFRAAGLPAPINRPGVIYRVDPATGKSSVFFDLNTVLPQIDSIAGTTPGNNPAGSGSGLVNWYKIAFDSSGVFDGKPSMFVTSLDSQDPAKNAVYRIGPDGSFMGLYLQFIPNASTGIPNIQPSAIYIPPPEQHTFLSGMLVGNGAGTTNPTNLASTTPVLFFNANQFVPGQQITNADPKSGIIATGMNLGPQVALTSANTTYVSPAYSAFTDFGVPASPGSQGSPGISGIQGLTGELLIAGGNNAIPASYLGQINSGANTVYYLTNPPVTITSADQAATIPTPFRRFQDMAFDYYNYFSYGTTVTSATTTAAATVTDPPTYAGSLFVTDLSPGLTASITAGGQNILVPVGGVGTFTITVDTTTKPNPTILGASFNTTYAGGRVVRVSPDGIISPFASGFHVDPSQTSSSFVNSTLSISFSADGTTLYVADMDGIWQFKTVTSLAGSTSGSLIGLNDLRSLGVPYEGQDLASAVVDTGVSANNPLFRGHVAPGKNVVMNGSGNVDLAGVPQGHGTEAAGVVAQMVPQSTILPVNVFTPNSSSLAPITGGTTANIIWNGVDWLTKHPNVADPLHPNTYDRVMSATFGFGTDVTFGTEGNAYAAYPQTTIALAGKFLQLRHMGITAIAAAGQLSTGQFGGTPNAAGLLDPIRDSISLPAVLNSVVSVTGSYSFPFATGPTADPVNTNSGLLANQSGPVLVTDASGAIIGGDLTTFSAADSLIFSDKIVGEANRNMTTDFVAPALNVPTFAAASTATTVISGGTGLATFQQGGTSLSSAIVTGAFNLVSSALSYWVTLNHQGGVTVDGYLNTMAGTHQLNFGPKGIGDLSAYLNPDGVNAILQWTSVPVRDQPNTVESTSSPQLWPNRNGPYPLLSRVSVSDAVASIEGTIALNYLINNGTLNIIDTNHNGLITAQELQTFEDNATNIGMAEAGVMARMLGGTDRIPVTGFQLTAAGESPEQPDVLQRRFNYFDYAANGQLTGVISIAQLTMLSKTLLPAPDAFVIIDRQRASANGYLLEPAKERNYVALQYTSPKYAFIPKSVLKHYKNISPSRFGVGRGQPLSAQTPGFTLFGVHATKASKATPVAGTNSQKPGAATSTPAATPRTAVAKTPTAVTPKTTTPSSTTSTGTSTTTTSAASTYQQNVTNSFLAAIAKAMGNSSSSTTSTSTSTTSTSSNSATKKNG